MKFKKLLMAVCACMIIAGMAVTAFAEKQVFEIEDGALGAWENTVMGDSSVAWVAGTTITVDAVADDTTGYTQLYIKEAVGNWPAIYYDETWYAAGTEITYTYTLEADYEAVAFQGAGIIINTITVETSEEDASEYPVYPAVKVDADAATDTPNIFQIDLGIFDGIDADITSIDFTMAPGNDLAWDGGQGWFGGGFAIGLDTADGWFQLDFAGDGEDEVSIGWAALADGGASSDPYSFSFVLPEGTETPYTVLDDESGELVSAGIIQFGYWWGSNNAIVLTDITVNFSDGTSVSLVDPTLPVPGDDEEDPSVEDPTEDPAPTATPSDADPSDQPPTGDNGIVVFAVVGMLALAGVVVTKKHNA